MKQKSKWIGLAVLLLVIAAVAGYLAFGQATKVVTLHGYVGGEKIGLLEDTEVESILKSKYRLALDYSKAGSLDMVTADHTGQDFLFPSSQTALEYYQQQYGSPVKSEIIFNTPLVLYSHRAVVQALVANGMVREENGSYYMDMNELAAALENGTKWSELGVSALYGAFGVNTTDPAKSNSGNMFAGLLANVLCGGVADAQSVDAVLPRLQRIFQSLGYMETSSADLFEQFLKTGMGAKPLVAGYESQLLEFAVENPDDWAKISDDIVMLYPTPTVWSTHIYIALDEAGKAAVDALLDADVQRLAWEKHGFRTGVSGTATDVTHFHVPGILAEVTQVVPMPSYAAMDKIIGALGG